MAGPCAAAGPWQARGGSLSGQNARVSTKVLRLPFLSIQNGWGPWIKYTPLSPSSSSIFCLGANENEREEVESVCGLATIHLA